MSVRCDNVQLTNDNIAGKAFRLENEMIDEFHDALITLDLHRNKLTEVNGIWFAKLKNLRSLFLSENKLTEVTDAPFASLSNLKILHLQGNQITSFTIQLANLNSIYQLDISDNKLTKLDRKYFESYSTWKSNGDNRTLYISENLLTCVCCPMIGFAEWLEVKNLKVISEGQNCIVIDKMEEFPIARLISIEADTCHLENRQKHDLMMACRGYNYHKCHEQF